MRTLLTTCPTTRPRQPRPQQCAPPRRRTTPTVLPLQCLVMMRTMKMRMRMMTRVMRRWRKRSTRRVGRGRGMTRAQARSRTVNSRQDPHPGTQNPSNPTMPQCVHQPRLFVEGPDFYFSWFFTPALINHIAHRTNLYATQRDVATTSTTDENGILSLVAILLYMGVCSLTSLDDFWALTTRVLQVAEAASSKHFRLPWRTVHLSNFRQ